jgi:hypothetical protein
MSRPEPKTSIDLTRGVLSLLVSEAARGNVLAWEMLKALGVGRWDHGI